jgi:cytidylate kinase
MPVVTIRGSLGTGAPEIGRLVAKILRIEYIDREIIREVSVRLNLQEQDILAKEVLPSSLRGRIADFIAQGYSEGDSFQGAYLPFWKMPLDDTSYLETLKSFISEVALEHSVVIHGRGSQFILKYHPRALHVSVVAPFEFRLKRVMETLGLNEIKAKQEMMRFDNSTREFMKRFFGAEVEDPTNYDVVVNAAHFGFENAALMITQALPLKQFHSVVADPRKNG